MYGHAADSDDYAVDSDDYAADSDDDDGDELTCIPSITASHSADRAPAA